MDRSAYDRWFHLEHHHFWRIAKRELILELVERHKPEPAPGQALRLLDIGGANSLLSRELGRFGEITIVEPDLPTVEFARQAHGLDVRHGSLPHDVPVEGTFDVITLIDVFEHIDDDLAAARAVFDLLRPGALLVASVPALPILWSDHDVANHHRRRYVRRTFHELLVGGGFVVERLSYHTSLLFPAVFAQRLYSRFRKGIQEKAEYPVKVPPAPINRAFYMAMTVERKLMRRVNMPIGSSLVAVCRRAT